MSRKLLLWAVILPVLGVLWFLGSSHFRGRWRVPGRNDPPVLDCPEIIDLGEQEWGQLATARFIITNRGGEELQIDHIQSSCSCAGLEREERDGFTRLTELRLGPGQEAHLALRVSVGGNAGGPARISLQFRTNDPARPLASVEVVIPLVTGVTTLPRVLAFGNVPTGATAHQVFEILNLSRKERAVERVVSNNPDRFSARLLPPGVDGDGGASSGTESLIGRIEVRLETETPGPVDGAVEIYFSGSEGRTVSVPVMGHVAADVEVTPSTLLLPRVSGGGTLAYGDCLCRSTKGEPLRITLDSAPEGITIQVSDVEGDPTAQMVRIAWEANSATRATAGAKVVRLKAAGGDRETSLEIRVYCRGGG
jgi:hypothetical protein